MCCKSSFQFYDERVKVYMGYYGSSIIIGDYTYSDNDDFVDKVQSNTAELIAKLKTYNQEQLVQFIVSMLDNAVEK